MKKILFVMILLNLVLLFSLSGCSSPNENKPDNQTVNYEGKTYNTILIGSQYWLKENLNVGTMISNSANQENNSSIEKYCYNGDPNNCTLYGGLYKWNEALAYNTTPGTRGICPFGWHIPTKAEFETLVVTLNNNGNALLSVGQGSGQNSSGFSALLAGNRNYDGNNNSLGLYTSFWSSTSDGNNPSAYTMFILSTNSNIHTDQLVTKENASSVRCIKD